MKKKILLVDVIILIISLTAFLVFKLSSIIAIIATIGLAVLLHTFFYTKFINEEIIEREQKRPSIEEEVFKLKAEFSNFENLINQFAHQVKEFKDRQDALKKLIELNAGEKGTYLLERSQEAEQFLLQKCRQIRKCLVILDVLDPDDAQYSQTLGVLDEITNSTQELIDVYSDLLSEVNKMGDGLKMDTPGLIKTVEKLKSLRSESETPEEQGLFVVSSDDF